MKGLSDYIRDIAGSVDNLPKITAILQPAGYSVAKICKELKMNYNTTLKEGIEISGRNETFDILIMLVQGQEYHRFFFYKSAGDIMSNIVEGLKKTPSSSCFQSEEYKTRESLRDTSARASRFKDAGDMTGAYYEK